MIDHGVIFDAPLVSTGFQVHACGISALAASPLLARPAPADHVCAVRPVTEVSADEWVYAVPRRARVHGRPVHFPRHREFLCEPVPRGQQQHKVSGRWFVHRGADE